MADTYIISIESGYEPAAPFFVAACSGEEAQRLARLADKAGLVGKVRRAGDPAAISDWLQEVAGE